MIGKGPMRASWVVGKIFFLGVWVVVTDWVDL